MPITKTGKKVLASMRKKYGKRAEEVFYASINKGKPGSSKWTKEYGKKSSSHKKKKYYSKNVVKMARKAIS